MPICTSMSRDQAPDLQNPSHSLLGGMEFFGDRSILF